MSFATPALDALRDTLPDDLKDIRLNVGAVLGGETLAPAQALGVALAAARFLRHRPLAEAIESDARAALGDAAGPVLADAVAAAAFRRLVTHLQHRHDAQNIDLMGLAGFCRNCLADWVMEADGQLTKDAAREIIHGMPAAEWKAKHQTEATPEQLQRMQESVAKNAPSH